MQEGEQLEAHPVQLTPGSEPTLAHPERPSFARDAASQVLALSHECAGSDLLCMRPKKCFSAVAQQSLLPAQALQQTCPGRRDC